MYSVILYESIKKNHIFNNTSGNAPYVQGSVMWESKRWPDRTFYFSEKPFNSRSLGDLMVQSHWSSPWHLSSHSKAAKGWRQHLSEPGTHRIQPQTQAVKKSVCLLKRPKKKLSSKHTSISSGANQQKHCMCRRGNGWALGMNSGEEEKECWFLFV